MKSFSSVCLVGKMIELTPLNVVPKSIAMTRVSRVRSALGVIMLRCWVTSWTEMRRLIDMRCWGWLLR